MYHWTNRNCEHFARWVVTGRPRSGQVENAVESTLAGAMVACLVGLAVVSSKDA